MSSRGRKKNKNEVINTNTPKNAYPVERRKLVRGAKAITVDEFMNGVKRDGDGITAADINHLLVDYIEIIGKGVQGEPDFNSISGNSTVVFTKPVVLLTEKNGTYRDANGESEMGSYGGDRGDDHRLIPQYSGKVLDQIRNGYEDSVNLITTTYIKLRKVATDHLDQEIAIQTAKGNKEYVEKLNEIKKDSEGWCRHFLCDYFVHLGDIKEELVDEEE